ncbi:MAG: 1-acyl-sn-glycerol-3-phosphate acyltransferase, partial [Elusimicrobia bacterium]|nr:1-acyl-sn-glycerol-3-phosphate acyltransferase [Elusimicrobiota bacterium]
MRQEDAEKKQFKISLFWQNLGRFVIEVLGRSFFSLKVSGLDYVPRTGRVLVAANHKSNWDPLLLGAVLGRIRRPYALAKAELFRNPLLGFLLDRWGAVRLWRQGADVGALKNAIALLTSGEMLIVIPEGTRKRENMLERSLPGIGYLYLKTQAPVVPVY